MWRIAPDPRGESDGLEAADLDLDSDGEEFEADAGLDGPQLVYAYDLPTYAEFAALQGVIDGPTRSVSPGPQLRHALPTRWAQRCRNTLDWRLVMPAKTRPRSKGLYTRPLNFAGRS